MSWSVIVKLLAGVGLPILAMWSAWIGITRYGASQFKAGQFQQQAIDGLDRLAMTEKRAKEREADDARQLAAWQHYTAFGDALRAASDRRHEMVASYAQTDAGQLPCLGADRVRQIEDTAASLGLFAAPAASKGDGGVLAAAAPDQRLR